jgi:hypothetical protein
MAFSRILLAALLALALTPEAFGQQQPPNGGNNNNQGGILIDAEGVLRSVRVVPERRVSRANKKSPASPAIRVVSLRRLGDLIRTAGVPIADLPNHLKTLGGLTAIDEIVLAIEDRDILLIGPGEDAVDQDGMRFVGARTGIPLIRTEDWTTILRTVRQGHSQITCSIDPDPERLRAYDARIRQTVGQVTLATAPKWYSQLAQVLGRQPVTIGGVPADSRVGVLLAAADFSMKRIALGAEPSGVNGIKSQLALAGGDKGASMQRWWFAPLYDPVEVDSDRTAFRLSGPRVQLCAQQELITPSGERQGAAHTRLSTQKFAQKFTEHFGELAEARPVFAELRQTFDMAVAAAVITREQFAPRSGCSLELWLDEEKLPMPVYSVPKSVESASTTRRVNLTTIVGLVGGVSLSPAEVLAHESGRDVSRPIPSPAAESLDRGQFVWPLDR